MAKKQDTDWNGDVITIKYGNGETFNGDCTGLPQEIYQPCAAARHGIGQKLGDAKSGATAGAKFIEVQKIWASLMAGQWNRRGEGVGVDSLMPRAYQILAESMHRPQEDADAWLAEYMGKTDDEKAVIRAKPHNAAAINRARSERALAGLEVPAGEADFDPNA